MQTQLCVPPETFALRLWTERIKEEGAQMRSSLNTTLSNTHTLQLCEGRRRHVHPPGSSAPREALNNCLSTITQGPEWRPLPCAFHGSARLGGGGVGSKTLSRTQPRPARWFQKDFIRFKSGDAVWLSGEGVTPATKPILAEHATGEAPGAIPVRQTGRPAAAPA